MIHTRSSLILVLFALSTSLSWANGQPASHHREYPTFLKALVGENGIAFQRVGKAQKAQLSQILAWQRDTLPKGTQLDQLAFWLNARNACVFKRILDHPNVNDLSEIESYLDGVFCHVAKSEYSLMALANTIMDLYAAHKPTLAFGFWWGTKGGPVLPQTPYTGENVESLLTKQAKRSLKDRMLMADANDPTSIKVSNWLGWYRDWLGPTPEQVSKAIRSLAPAAYQEKLPKGQIPQTAYMEFKWTLDHSPRNK